MKSTREKVLHTLATNPRSPIVDIANAVGINSISVRHHLTSLQANGLVNAEEERHGVGRPRLVYSLTEIGQENFPKRYFRLTTKLLDQMKKTISDEDLKSIFKNMANDLSNEYGETLSSLSFEQKLDLLMKIMANEGYDLTWVKTGNGYEISEVTCPFYQLGKDHPEICLFDQTLIANILSISETEIIRERKGDNLCSFRIKQRI